MRLVLVRALKHFDQYVLGQDYWVPMTESVAHLIVDNYFRLLQDPGWEVSDAAGQGQDLHSDRP
jgi:hypothetical protein